MILAQQSIGVNFSRSPAINRNAARRPARGAPPAHNSYGAPPAAAHAGSFAGSAPYGGSAAGGGYGAPPPSGGGYHSSAPKVDPQATVSGGRVLHFLVRAAVYPLDANTMLTLMSAHGQVLRIVMFYKNTLQGFVEFAEAAAAAAAYAALDGQDIYDGCCHLQINYAKNHGSVNVRGSNEQSIDLTNPSLAPVPLQGPNPTQIAEMEQARAAGQPIPTFPPPQAPPPRAPTSYGAPPPAGPPGQYGAPAPSGAHGHGAPPHAAAAVPPGVVPTGADTPQGGQGCVAIVYGTNDAAMGVDQVFNLACCFGNVVRVRRLTHKTGTVLLQMADAAMVNGLVQFLAGAVVFGSALRLEVSKFRMVSSPPKPEDFMVINGEKTRVLSFKEFFMNPELSRFRRPEHFANVRPPHPVLHLSNVPAAMFPVDLRQLLQAHGAPSPLRIMLFAASKQAQKRNARITGLVEFRSVNDATDALALANNAALDGVPLRFAYSDQSIKSSGPDDGKLGNAVTRAEREDFVRRTGLGLGLEDPAAADAASKRGGEGGGSAPPHNPHHPRPMGGYAGAGDRDRSASHDSRGGSQEPSSGRYVSRYSAPPTSAPPAGMAPPPGMAPPAGLPPPPGAAQ